MQLGAGALCPSQRRSRPGLQRAPGQLLRWPQHPLLHLVEQVPNHPTTTCPEGTSDSPFSKAIKSVLHSTLQGRTFVDYSRCHEKKQLLLLITMFKLLSAAMHLVFPGHVSYDLKTLCWHDQPPGRAGSADSPKPTLHWEAAN